MSYAAPFEGLRVLDLSQGIAGPYAGMLLAQHGADVIKVEPPGGDWSRTLGKRYGDHTAFSIAANLGKRSIALDLKHHRDRAIAHRLGARADVVMESFRPGVATRLGVGYMELSAVNPRLLYLSVSGFGQSGPESSRPAMDPILQAFTGLMAMNKGLDGIPHRVVPIVVDMTTAFYAFQSIAVALYARRDETAGRYLDTSLMQATAGGWMYIVTHRDADFGKLCEALGIPGVKDDPRFTTNALRSQHLTVLTDALNPAFARGTTEQLAKRLREAGIMHSPVHDYLDFLRQPQLEATGLIAWLDQPGVGQ